MAVGIMAVQVHPTKYIRRLYYENQIIVPFAIYFIGFNWNGVTLFMPLVIWDDVSCVPYSIISLIGNNYFTFGYLVKFWNHIFIHTNIQKSYENITW